ncbi:MAG: 23S rRNA (uracil1939-C5)-methyltransferase [Myxococcota bacterium]|jgi:23S rRNA (uracil1939-C5)-methyltransferase
MGKLRGLEPFRWSPKGEAVASVPGERRPLHVWEGIVGEVGDVELGYVGQHQAFGNWVHASRPHPHRVHPICPRYTKCGGCAWMHMNAEGQEAGRRTLVRAALDESGLDDVELGTWTPSPHGLVGFRHVVKVGFDIAPSGKLRMGAWGRRTREVVPIPKCDVAAPVLRKVMASLAHHSIDLRLRPYDPETDRGVIRAAVLRASRSTGEVLVTLVAGRRTRELSDLAEIMARQCPEIVGVWLHMNGEPGNAIYARGEDGTIGISPLTGRDHIQETLGEVTYLIGPGDFFQTNPSVAQVLYERVMDRLDPGPDDSVIDLYCGVGGLALQAAARGAFVTGIEEVAGAVERARAAAHLNGLRARFTVGEVHEELPVLAAQVADTSPLVMVNPARRGLEPGVVESILTLKPRRIAYVSCNAGALARDLALFREHGFKIGPVDMFDMFPNTPHVETLTVLEPLVAPTATRRPPRRRLVRR